MTDAGGLVGGRTGVTEADARWSRLALIGRALPQAAKHPNPPRGWLVEWQHIMPCPSWSKRSIEALLDRRTRTVMPCKDLCVEGEKLVARGQVICSYRPSGTETSPSGARSLRAK